MEWVLGTLGVHRRTLDAVAQSHRGGFDCTSRKASSPRQRRPGALLKIRRCGGQARREAGVLPEPVAFGFTHA
jgi:hypothetical protein